MSEAIFPNGLVFKLAENAPDYIKGKLSIKVEEFITFCRQNENNGWLNIDLKVSQGGKAYAQLNTWKPDGQSGSQKNSNNDFRAKDSASGFEKYQPPNKNATPEIFQDDDLSDIPF